jgi:hypothetical protein
MTTTQQGQAAPTKRAAIYTRKSTSAGLEQAFNSLDAQREACVGYIERQGWTLIDEQYECSILRPLRNDCDPRVTIPALLRPLRTHGTTDSSRVGPPRPGDRRCQRCAR